MSVFAAVVFADVLIINDDFEVVIGMVFCSGLDLHIYLELLICPPSSNLFVALFIIILALRSNIVVIV